MKLRIAVLPGDGIGPEVTAAGTRVLDAVAERFGHTIEMRSHAIGWAAIEHADEPLPAETRAATRAADSVLLGAVGDPRGAELPPDRRPEAGLLELRQALGCYANLRAARVLPSLRGRSPLRPEAVDGTDILVVRELAGGLYYGTPRRDDAEAGAVNTMAYTADEVRRIARVAFQLARARSGRLVSIDKANVLEVSRLWRRTVDEVAADFPDVDCRHLLVDRAAMDLVLRPASFDVVLTPNLFGDILSDELAAVVGSIGVLGSASVGGRTDIYEPVHGSAPDIAGRDRANPIGMITSAALMLEHTFGLHREARALSGAVEAVLARGLRTADLAAGHETAVGTHAFADAVATEVMESAGTDEATPALETR